VSTYNSKRITRNINDLSVIQSPDESKNESLNTKISLLATERHKQMIQLLSKTLKDRTLLDEIIRKKSDANRIKSDTEVAKKIRTRF
jgi:ABC-type uncharacterized transport system substrate-binding protein